MSAPSARADALARLLERGQRGGPAVSRARDERGREATGPKTGGGADTHKGEAPGELSARSALFC
jgi:hypothetical protein